MSTSELTLNEAMESINGFDEIAIEKHMGYDIYTSDEEGSGVYREKPVLMIRCLIFVMQRRTGQTDVEARRAVMEMTVKDVHDYFADDPEDLDPDDPDSESGKDEPQHDVEHTSSPLSASSPE